MSRIAISHERIVFFSQHFLHGALEVFELFEGDWVAAERADLVGLQPLRDAVRVEVVVDVARQGRNLDVLVELLAANGALGVALE